MPGHDSLTVAEAAKDLGQTVQHTRRLLREGALRGSKPGRDWLVDAESVDERKTLLANKPKGKGRPRRGASTQYASSDDSADHRR